MEYERCESHEECDDAHKLGERLRLRSARPRTDTRANDPDEIHHLQEMMK